RQVDIYHPVQTEFFDYAANERLNERLFQTYMEMSLETSMEGDAAGISGKVALLPAAFVSAAEAHAAVAVCEILNYDITDDTATPGGLRFVEWLRGYAVLQQFAIERRDANESGANNVFPV